MMSLAYRAVDADEWMDDPECDPARLARTYRHFGLLNRAIGRWPAIYRSLIGPALADAGPRSLLDVGFGGGDITRRIAAWAARDGIDLSITAIDPDPRALAFASAAPASGVEFRATTSRALVADGRTFDVVISNHVLHHVEGLGDFLEDSERLARRLVVHSDIERGPGAYAAYSVLALPLAAGSFARADGLTSIRRSYTRAELEAESPPGWTVERKRPSRLLLTRTIGTDA